MELYLDGLSLEEKLSLIIKCAKECRSDYRRLEKASNAEKSLPLHSSRARQTSAYARTHNCGRMYHESKNILKEAIKWIK